ncbi:phospholipase/carboxylesterase [Cyclobacterium xiamenense]|uniref:Phospholipase/carboxylesterase n=1 Tax=Cyclobacterium xiamenense TaxID=1297121 RepID=A0A1H6YJP3_9BACT|nr:dienelactone hydrolase family protein [Cyclobacterium xiamenense]SEJ37450.1 phospholipase/carboxylesterase [Cyclobacterium xiamenense]
MDQLIQTGTDRSRARDVAIVLHGRGGTAFGMKPLLAALDLPEFAFLIPQAPGNTWYPYGFMVDESDNEPFLQQSLEGIHALVASVQAEGQPSSSIYFIGFSQGACLALEYVARYPRFYGGVCAFTGGLIGKYLPEEKYQGDLAGTPIFIGASERDIHVPMNRIRLSGERLSQMGAVVKVLGFDDALHTIREEEIVAGKEFVFREHT